MICSDLSRVLLNVKPNRRKRGLMWVHNVDCMCHQVQARPLCVRVPRGIPFDVVGVPGANAPDGPKLLATIGSPDSKGQPEAEQKDADAHDKIKKRKVIGQPLKHRHQ